MEEEEAAPVGLEEEEIAPEIEIVPINPWVEIDP